MPRDSLNPKQLLLFFFFCFLALRNITWRVFMVTTQVRPVIELETNRATPLHTHTCCRHQCDCCCFVRMINQNSVVIIIEKSAVSHLEIGSRTKVGQYLHEQFPAPTSVFIAKLRPRGSSFRGGNGDKDFFLLRSMCDAFYAPAARG